MVRKILILLSMVVFHAGCSGGGSNSAATPQPSVAVNGYYGNCTAEEEAFEGGQISESVVCLPKKTLAMYGGEIYRRKHHGHGRGGRELQMGVLCRDAQDTVCGEAACQPFAERNYGFCLSR